MPVIVENDADGVADGTSPQMLLRHAYADDDGERPSLIDLRDAESFMKSRLRGSYNVPLECLVARMFLLPDRVTPLGLMVGGPPAAQTVQGAAAAGGAKEEIQVVTFLASRGWRVAFCVEASTELWRVAAEKGVLEVGGDALSVKRRWPFQPSKLLMQQARLIEEMLVKSWLSLKAERTALDSVAPAGGCHVGPDPDASNDNRLTLRMLDVGCGSGRDLAWLSTRRPCVVVPGDDGEPNADAAEVHVEWECVGLDSWHGALQRAAEVLTLGDVAAGLGGVTLHLAQIGPGTSVLKPLALPPAGAKGDQRQLLLRYLAAPEHKQQHASAAESAEASGRCSGATGAITICDPPERGAEEGARAGGEEVPQSAVDSLTLGCFDLLVCVRFLERSFLESMAALLRPGGVILFSTFVDGPGLRAFGRPQGREHVLQPDELAKSFFGPDQGFQVLRDDIEAIPDGREVTMFCARKAVAA